MFRNFGALVVLSLLAGTALAQPPESDEARMKYLWEYCQSKLNGSASKEGCKVEKEMMPWSHVAVRAKMEEMVRRAPPSQPTPPTAEEQALRDFCENRMGGVPTVVGCMKNSAFTDWPDVAKRMKAEAGVKYPTVAPGQWKMTFTKASITSNDPNFDASKMKPPSELDKCITAKEVSNGLLGMLVQMMKDCEYVKNSDKDGAVDIELKCENSDTTGRITAKGMITPKKFRLDYAMAFDGTGKETGKQLRASFVVAGDWQSATCKQ